MTDGLQRATHEGGALSQTGEVTHDEIWLSPERAAQLLFNDRQASITFEAATEEEARRAVEEFARIFENLPGAIKDMIEGAQAAAETLSGDPLQVLAEIIQNADDSGATYVEFRIREGHLVAIHDGRSVSLRDALSLAAPWLTGKTNDVLAIGRFGIGLMTHRAISDVLDVHSGPYHMRLGAPSISAIALADLVAELPLGATAFSMPIRDDVVDIDDVSGWLSRWDDSALLFLRHVGRVVVLKADSVPAGTITLSWTEDSAATCVVDGHELTVQRRHARAPDGRGWLVHSAEAPAPKRVSRMRKASGPTVPLGLALPLQPQEGGVIYAGLPLVKTGVPLLVNAQFNPVTGRTGLASMPWNRAMLPLLADLWVEVVEDLFAEMPVVAWDVVPLPGDTGNDPSSVVEQLERLLLGRARHELANRVAIVVGGAAIPLTKLAVENAVLENVITQDEVASLAGLGASLSASARDPGGRWRHVLNDWREAGAPLPPSVTIQTALPLVEDAGRSPKAAIALAAVALNADLADEVAEMACVVTATSAHIVPPTEESLQALMVTASPLAEQLGIGVGLAEEHLAETSDAQVVLAWLREIGAVIDNPHSEKVIRRLATAGQAGRCLDAPLRDDQLRALRDAFEEIPAKTRDEMGRDVGLAITIAAFRYDARGRTVQTHARPADVYLSRAIDREQDSFAVAASKTTGLLWTHNRYANQLRSELGRTAGLGPQKFLRLLGAEMAPRLVPHAALNERFPSDGRLGLGLAVPSSPPQRAQAVRVLGASYTLSDIDSPDFRAVAVNIANEPNAEHRRARAAALLGALGRGWDRLEGQADVVAADDYYVWQIKGPVRAFWLWSVGSIKWLDDTGGIAQAPLDLRLRTPATIAVHGPDAPGYLRPEFNSPNRRDVLAALGVSGEPSTRDLVDRLRGLLATKPEPDTVATDAAIVYQAIADRLASRTSVPGDLSPRDLHAAFDEGEGLVYTNLGWRRPTQVLRGPAVFRGRHAFVPQVRNTEALWNLLRVRQPSLKDCLDVISQMARTRRAPSGNDVMVLLETLRLMANGIGAAPDQPRAVSRRLAAMPLWTTQGWKTDRPVYALDDPALREGLRAEIPVWAPGGETSQFASLLGPLRITALPADASTVIDAEAAIPDGDATELLGAAVCLLQEDLARNDPLTAGALAIGWDRLQQFEARIDPDLRVHVDGLVGGRSVEVEVATKADVARAVLFLRDTDLLGQVAAGGRAIAGIFSAANRRQLAQAWLAAVVQAEGGRRAELIVLAEQQAAEDQARADRDIAKRTAALGQEIAGRQQEQARRRSARAASAGTASSSATTETGKTPLPSPAPRERVLVDPSTLTVANVYGQPDEPSRRPTQRVSRGSSPLPPPDRNAGPPRRGVSAPSFTPLDKETVGLELARLVLGGDAAEIADLRAQHRVGADAVDDMDRFYELKVHLGDEPDSIRLEESEIRRAMTTKDFFLVVVSNIEGANARPKVRIIVDPVRQLTITRSSSVNFTGVRDTEHSLVYDLEPFPEEE